MAKSIKSIIPAFSGIVSENNYFSEKTEHVRRDATLIKPCLERRKTISTFIRCCLYILIRKVFVIVKISEKSLCMMGIIDHFSNFIGED